MNVKRRVVEERWRAVIENLYAGERIQSADETALRTIPGIGPTVAHDDQIDVLCRDQAQNLPIGFARRRRWLWRAPVPDVVPTCSAVM